MTSDTETHHKSGGQQKRQGSEGPVVRYVTVLSDGTGCESEGANGGELSDERPLPHGRSSVNYVV
jgi:hypothetical protein